VGRTCGGIWLDPTIATGKKTLFVNADTQFGAGYGDLLSGDERYQYKLGAQRAPVVRTVDPVRLEALMIRLIGDEAKRERRK
jgi:hypothetical protein